METDAPLPEDAADRKLVTLAENLAFLAGFAEGIAAARHPKTDHSAGEEDLEILMAEVLAELPEGGWRPTARFKA